jgi:type II secretory pathway component GspD/PulD (secretin)
MAIRALPLLRLAVPVTCVSAVLLLTSCATSSDPSIEDEHALSLDVPANDAGTDAAFNASVPEVAAAVVPDAAVTTAVVATSAMTQDSATDDTTKVAAEAEERWKIKQQQLQMEAEATYTEGMKLLEQNRVDDAILYFDQVLNHIRVAPVSVNWGNLEERATSAKEQAERARAKSKAETSRERDAQAFAKIQEAEQAAAQRRQSQILVLLDDSIAAYNRNDFADAERLSNEVLKQDPHNDRARRLNVAAVEAQRTSANEDAVEKRKEEFRRWKQEIEETRIPYADIHIGPNPDDWRKLTEKRNAANLLALGEIETAQDKELRQRVANTRIASIAFPDMPVAEAVNGISIISGVPIVIDPEVKAELDLSGTPLNLSTLTDIPVESLLNIVTAQAGEGLTWTVRHGVVFMTKKEKALQTGVPRFHSVRDLSFKYTDFRGPEIGRISKPGEEPTDDSGGIFGNEIAGPPVGLEPEAIVTLIKENIGRETWDGGVYSIDVANGSDILVIHTPDTHLRIAQFLDDLRRFTSSVVTIESRFITLREGFLQEIGVDFRGLGGSGPGTEAFLNDVTFGLEDNAGTAADNSGPGLETGAGLNPVAGAFFNDGSDGDVRAFTQNFFESALTESALGRNLTNIGGATFQVALFKGESQYNAVIRAVEKSEFATTISTPILTAVNTVRSYFTVVNQVSFIQDFDVDVANSAFIANPNVGIIQEGVALDVRPTISYDRKFITLEVQATVADLLRPIRLFSTSLAGFSVPVTFQLPELVVQQAKTTVRVPDRGALILGGLKRLNYVNRTAEVPWLGRIPLIGILFRQKGLDDETENLIITIRASITDVSAYRDNTIASK